MLSITPAVTRKPTFGLPYALNGSQECQSGCGSIATRQPAASSTRLMMARPKEG